MSSIEAAIGRRFGYAGDAAVERYVRWVGGAGAAVTALWLWFQLDVLDQRIFGNFYDLQARALLDGHWDVPAGSLGNEAFQVRGQEYLYNPPGPSLLRMPVMLVTDRFDGRLTVLSMFLAWLLTVVLFSLLIWRVRRLLRGTAPLPRWEAAGYAGLLVACTAGTGLLYLASIPWIFHEVYTWAVPMAVGVAFALLEVLRRRGAAGLVAAGLFTLGAVMTRATAGYACGLGVLAVAAWFASGRAGAAARSAWWKVALAGAVPLAVGMAVNWAKFRHPWSVPFDQQLYTSRLEIRRRILEDTDGVGFSPGTLLATVPAYLRPDGIRFSAVFPFITLPAEPAPAYGDVVLASSYRTGSVLSFMPLLVGLAVWGTITTVRRGIEATLPLLGVSLIPAAVLVAPFITHRYTAEFLPWLVVAGTFGTVALVPGLRNLHPRTRSLTLGGLGLLLAFSVLANLAVAVNTQALANPGPTLGDFVARQDRYGASIDDRVAVSVQLPPVGPADEIRIVGACDAMYQGTGEHDLPWAEVGTRERAADLTWSGQVGDPGEVRLAQFVGHHTIDLTLASRGDGAFRLELSGGGFDEAGEWTTLEPGRPARLTIETDDPVDHVARLGDSVVRIPKQSPDAEFVNLPNVLVPDPVDQVGLAPAGLTAVEVDTPELAPCAPLLDRYLG